MVEREEKAAADQRDRENRIAALQALIESGDDHDGLDELTERSNRAVELVRAGKLDEAEQLGHELLQRFPEFHDGYDRLGMVYEARGDKRQAADYYRKVIEMIRSNPDEYEPGFDELYQELVAELDPPAAS